jgi:hypothetical protein
VCVCGALDIAVFIYEHSKQARVPHTHGPRDIPRFGAVSLLQKPLHHRGFNPNSCPAFVYVGLGPVAARARVSITRYLVVVLRLLAAALIVRCRYLIVVSRSLPAAPLVAHRRYLIAAPGRCPRRRSLCAAGTWSWCSGRCPQRRSLCIEGLCVHLSWCPGRCPLRRSFCVEGT